MNKKIWQLVLLLVLAAVYVIFFTDWFKTKHLMIHYTTRPTGMAMRRRATNLPPTITFGFDQRYALKEIKVIAVAALATNNNPLPLWHLVSDSNSVPYESFHYGQQLRGMHPVVPGEHAAPLDPTQTYRLLVQAVKINGQHDFTLSGPMPDAATNSP